MKLFLGNPEDVKSFMKRRKSILREIKSNSEVIIPTKVLVAVFNDFEDLIKDYENKISHFESKLNFESTNCVKEWIEEQVDYFTNYSEEDKPTYEIRKEALATVKEELANLKSEYMLKSFNITDKKYNFIFMVYDCYKLEPEAIIDKVEKDLAEFVLPVNAVDEVEVESV